MIKTSWIKSQKWLELVKSKLSKARNGIPAKYLRRPWPSGNKSRDH